MQVPNLSEWWWRYRNIVSKLGIDEVRDRLATRILAELLRGTDIRQSIMCLERALRGCVAIVMGAGPRLEQHVSALRGIGALMEVPILVADGVSRLLLELDIVPLAIVTDLDGGPSAVLELGCKGAIIALHGHGDNIERILEWVPRARKNSVKIIGTTQVDPIDPLINIGGFTDGDRALLLALMFTPRVVILVGMDFGDVVGPYSKPWLSTAVKADERKKLKLDIAMEIVEDAACRSRSEVYTLSPIQLSCVSRVSLEEVKHILRS